jgi:tetratricopeptide (TPR) repeat protein
MVFIEGRYLVDHEHYEDALVCFRNLLEVDVSTLPDAGPAYDAGIFGALSYDACGVCLFKLGRYEGAAAAWAAASEDSPEDASYRTKRDLALARHARSGGARPASEERPDPGLEPLVRA